ncbi:hypothetical protein N7463_000718 [Penicillium fimorum]|uniref:Uncharacterized protein n=1 Tax=Penicillium fimorum TaxID=1882269 RepID=A0A9W9Y4V0_9EURO|nr:hypothetical protein N7463_000718 [Penicillium fimorum]
MASGHPWAVSQAIKDAKKDGSSVSNILNDNAEYTRTLFQKFPPRAQIGGTSTSRWAAYVRQELGD